MVGVRRDRLVLPRCLPNVLSLSRARPSRSGSATRSVAPNEARKRRASERPRVGCCEELAGAPFRSLARGMLCAHSQQHRGNREQHSRSDRQILLMTQLALRGWHANPTRRPVTDQRSTPSADTPLAWQRRLSCLGLAAERFLRTRVGIRVVTV